MKKVLSVALALTMIISVFAMQASAHPTDTKTFVLMDDDMSGIITGWADGDDAYNAGTRWGYRWDLPTTQISVTDGNTVIKSYTAKNAGEETVITKKLFTATPVRTSTSRIAFTQDVKTGARSTEGVTIYNRVYNGTENYEMSAYNTKTGTFTHMGYNGKTFTLSENTEYTIVYAFAYDPVLKNHKLTITITDKAGSASITDATLAEGEQHLSTVSNTVWDYYKENITTMANINYRVYSNEKATVDGAELFTFQNIKVEETVKGDIINFSDIRYNNDGVMLDEKMGDLDVVAINKVTTADAGYLNGNTWANASGADMWKLNGISKTDGEYFWAVTSKDGSTNNKMVKKFDSVPAGGKLTFTGTFKTNKPGGKDYAVTLVLGNDDLSRTVSVIRFYEKAYSGFYFSSLGTNDDVGAWSESNGTVFMDGDWAIDVSTKPLYKGTDIPFTFTMTPNAEDSTKYDLSIITGIGGVYTATRQIDKATAESFNTVGIYIHNNWYDVNENFMGLKNLKITTEGTKTALVAGNNTIYLPIENVTGHAVDFALIAAVCDKATDKHKEYFVETYDEHCANSDNLAIDVTITDPATEYVKLYIWDSFGILRPYTEPIDTK